MGRLRKAILTMSPLSLIGFLVDSNYHAGIAAMEEGRYAKAVSLFHEAIIPTIDLPTPAYKDPEISTDLNVIGSYYELGKIYLFGMGGMPKENEIAITYLKKAASSHRHTRIRTQAQLLIGLYYKDQIDDMQNDNQAWALFWLNEAAKNGSNDALYHLILYYYQIIQSSSAREIKIGSEFVGRNNAIENTLDMYRERIEGSQFEKELPAGVSCAVKRLKKETNPTLIHNY